MRLTNLRDHLAWLLNQFGSWRLLGSAVGIDHSYLFRLYRGESEPSDETCRKLGLRAHTIYEIVNETPVPDFEPQRGKPGGGAIHRIRG